MAERESSDSLKAFFRNFRAATTGRWAISFSTSSLVIAEGIIFAIERESRLISNNSHSRVLVVVAGELIGILYLFTAQELLLKNRKTAAQSLISCFFVWVSAGVIRGLASSLYAHFALGLPLFLFERISNTFLFTSCGLLTVAYFAGKIELDRVANSGLATLNKFLARDEVFLNEAAIEERQRALDGLRDALLPKAVQLRALVATLNTGEGNDSTTKELEALRQQTERLAISIEEERRKLLTSQTISDDAHPFKNIRINFLTGFLPKTISVRISAIVFAFGAVAGQIPRNGFNGFKFAVVSLIGIVLLLYVSSRLSRRLTGSGLRFIYVLTYAAAFLFPYFLTKYQSQLGFSLRDSNPPIAAGLKTISTIYFSSVFASLLTDNSRRRESLVFENQSIRERLDDASQTHSKFQNQAVSIHFGVIQGKISGVIMALQITKESQGVHHPSSDTARMLTQTNALLDEAILEIASLGH